MILLMHCFGRHLVVDLVVLEYILGPQLWDHVIALLTWGFCTDDRDERIENCRNERKEKFETIDKKITKKNLTLKRKRLKKGQVAIVIILE